MAQQTPNKFTTYILTEEEILQGSILNEQQTCVFQNERARIAEEKLMLAIDSTDVIKAAQDEAYKLGQLELMDWILDSSEAANNALNKPENNTTEV